MNTHSCDANIIVGDFNIDFSRVSTSANYWSMFMASFDFVACDLAYGSSLSYTYERDDGTVRSWIDYIFCSGSHCHLIGHCCGKYRQKHTLQKCHCSWYINISDSLLHTVYSYIIPDTCSPPSLWRRGGDIKLCCVPSREHGVLWGWSPPICHSSSVCSPPPLTPTTTAAYLISTTVEDKGK